MTSHGSEGRLTLHFLPGYAPDLKPFEAVMQEYGIRRNDKMKLLTEGEHLHSTDNSYREMFEQVCYRLGVGKSYERVGSGDWSE